VSDSNSIVQYRENGRAGWFKGGVSYVVANKDTGTVPNPLIHDLGLKDENEKEDD
jgi:hypothetical protein